MHDIVKPYYDDTFECIRCGVCLSVCPVYAAEKHEGTVARGKIRLVKELIEGKLELTPRLKEFMELCLACGACVENCPPKVKTDKIVVAARAQFVKEQGLPFIFNIALRWVMKNPGMTKTMFSSLGLARSTLMTKVFPQKIKEMEQLVPPLPNNTFWELYRKRRPFKSEKKVGYFVGCMTNLVYPQVGMAVLDILENNGYEVIVPQGYCCGIPHYISGDIDTAKELAAKNIQLFKDKGVDTVLTDCGSCGGTLKEYEHWLNNGDAKAFGAKTRDVSEFLVNEVKVSPGTKNVDLMVTYHDSCHLSRTMGVKGEPRKLLQSIEGLEYKEMADANRCCGGAGTFNMKQYDVSMKILNQKMDNIQNTQANVIAVGCPSCRMQLTHGLQKFPGNAQEVLHPVEILAKSL